MSFSFNVKAPTVETAVAKVIDEMAKVTAQQPVHERDASAVLDAAKSYLWLAGEPAQGKQLSVAVAGSIWMSGENVGGLTLSLNIIFVNAAEAQAVAA